MAFLSSRPFYSHTHAFLILSRQLIRTYAAGSAVQARGAYPAPRMQPQKSFQLALKKMVEKEMPDDVGLLPGTFIMPTGDAKPSIFREPGLRWKLEVRRLKARVENIRGAITYKYLVHEKPYPRLARRKALATATALHKRMYTAFAEYEINDIATLSSICAEGLLDSFKIRLASIPQDVTQRWILHRYVKPPRIVSDRASLLQVKGTAIRQVTVRIKSTQSLTKIHRYPQTTKEATVRGTDDGQMMDEYFVIQRRIWKGQEEPWRIWGTTQEANVKELL